MSMPCSRISSMHFASSQSSWRYSAIKEDRSCQPLGANEAIGYKRRKFDNEVSDIEMTFDLIGGETQEQSWGILKKEAS